MRTACLYRDRLFVLFSVPSDPPTAELCIFSATATATAAAAAADADARVVVEIAAMQ